MNRKDIAPLKGATKAITTRQLALACYKFFGRGVLVYIPRSHPSYSLIPESEIDKLLMKSYKPTKEFVLSWPTVDASFRTMRDFIDIPFLTQIIKNRKDPKSKLRILVDRSFDLESKKDLEETVFILRGSTDKTQSQESEKLSSS